MSEYSAATTAIYEKFFAAWGGLTPISVDNAPYTPTAGTSFVHLSVRFANQRQLTLGAADCRSFRLNGLIEIEIFTPANVGTGENTSLIDAVSTALKATEFDGVLTRAPTIASSGASDSHDGNWWKTPVFVTFQFDNIE